MGMKVIFMSITLLIINVGDSFVLRSADGQKRYGGLVAGLHIQALHNLSPIHNSPTKAPAHHHNLRPSKRHAKKWIPGSAPSPSISFHKYHHGRKRFGNFAPEPSNQLHPPTYNLQGLVPSISPFRSLSPTSKSWVSPGPAPSQTFPSRQFAMPMSSPTISPSSSSLKKKKIFPPSQVLMLPPPPPNKDCTSVTCTEPLTYTPAGSPCACVWPIEVRLRLSISPYTFFPLVSELAKEISRGVSLNESQARIMGANAAVEQLEKTIVLVNLVPLKENFDPATALLIYRKFWKKQVFINTSRFGAYEVVYVHYPGLPPSPPLMPSNTAMINDQPYSGGDHKGRPSKPLGVDVPRRKEKGTGGSVIVIVVLSSVTAFVVCMGVVWLLLLKCGVCSNSTTEKCARALTSSHGKPSGNAIPTDSKQQTHNLNIFLG